MRWLCHSCYSQPEVDTSSFFLGGGESIIGGKNFPTKDTNIVITCPINVPS